MVEENGLEEGGGVYNVLNDGYRVDIHDPRALHHHHHHLMEIWTNIRFNGLNFFFLFRLSHNTTLHYTTPFFFLAFLCDLLYFFSFQSY